MKMMIDSSGSLLIERAGKMVEQICPFTQIGRHCGDECPLFGEPGLIHLGDDDYAYGIRICQDRNLIGEVTDERENE